MTRTRFINRFSEKILVWANRSFWAQKLAHPHNSGLAVKNFQKFCTVKGAYRQMKIILMIISKKFLFGANELLRTQNDASSQLWIRCKNYFTILYDVIASETYQKYINGFSQKNFYSRQLCHFGPKMVRPLNFQDLLSGFSLILHNKKG